MKDESKNLHASITIEPIGSIHSLVQEQQTGGFEGIESLVELRPEFSEYLVGLEDYSHLHVIYWLSEMDETHGLHRPQANPDVPVVGMFACR
jgi:tRNA (Thr-GGU) A37 N-methylase